MPPLDYVWVKTDIYDMSTDYKYWMSLYHSVLILAGNDIGPRGELQLIVCMLFVTIGAIINGNIFGELAVLMAAMNRKQTRFSEQIDTTNTAMANLRLPGYIQKSIQQYIVYRHQTLDSQEELEKFLHLISPSLIVDVTKEIFSKVIYRNKLLHKEPDVVEYMLKRLKIQLKKPEETIIRQGENKYEIYMLAMGECEVKVRDEFRKEQIVKRLRPGNMFGEVAFITKNR